MLILCIKLRQIFTNFSVICSKQKLFKNYFPSDFFFMGFLRSKAKTYEYVKMISLCLVICVTHLGFCLRFIVYEKPLNLENTSSVLSVLLFIYGEVVVVGSALIIFPWQQMWALDNTLKK